MNKTKYIILLLLFSLPLHVQAIAASNYTDKSDSLEFITLFNKGQDAYDNKQFESAKNIFIETISKPIPSNDTDITKPLPFQLAGFEYLHMKKQAANILKQIYFEEKDFKLALYYHNLTTGIYKVNYFGCGLGLMSDAANSVLFKSKCFEELNQYDSAMSALVSHMDYYSERFVDLAVMKVGIDSLKSEMIFALNNLKLYGNRFMLTLLGNEICVALFKMQTRVINEYKYTNSNGDTVKVQAREDIPLTDKEKEIAIEKQKESFKNSKLYMLVMEYKKKNY
ncbi:MAG: hypothetical protein EHM58_17730 [Ignavibacteriae bacterium]|nr:MAG: hypothetical protein EHM58_17730 [Ignavibacteriota bacterium]